MIQFPTTSPEMTRLVMIQVSTTLQEMRKARSNRTMTLLVKLILERFHGTGDTVMFQLSMSCILTKLPRTMHDGSRNSTRPVLRVHLLVTRNIVRILIFVPRESREMKKFSVNFALQLV